MDGVADLLREDDPPESGLRIRVPTLQPPGPPPSTHAADRASSDVLVEVGEEVFFEVWGAVRVLFPLQGPWFRVGRRELGVVGLSLAAWRCGPAPRATLRARWPELVPGYAAMDRLVGLMVDAIC